MWAGPRPVSYTHLHYLLKADLPGFKKEDIHLNLDGDTLTLSLIHI